MNVRSEKQTVNLEIVHSFSELLYVIMPTMFGLALARLGLSVSTYASYNATDNGLFSDSVSLAVSAVSLIFVAILFVKRVHLHDRTLLIMSSSAYAVQGLTIFLYGALQLVFDISIELLLVLAFLITLSSWFAELSWLRRARYATSVTVVILVLGAIMLSEVLLYVFSLLPQAIACCIVGVLVLLQFFVRSYVTRKPSLAEIHSDVTPLGYFGFVYHTIDLTRMLTILSIGLILLSCVAGALRGYPYGESIEFTQLSRLLYVVLLVALFSFFIWRVYKQSQAILSSVTWVVLEILGMIALILYAAFPDDLYIGAVFTTVFNAIIIAVMWYLIVAFASYGELDPCCYAVSGFIVVAGSSAFVRHSMMWANPWYDNLSLELVILCAAILVGTQAILRFLRTPEHESPASPNAFLVSAQKVLGLSTIEPYEQEDSMLVGIREGVIFLTETYHLTQRESEVLALYASGMTQKQIAEELFVSHATIHSHIKNIYSKTDLHSRQEVLESISDYMV